MVKVKVSFSISKEALKRIREIYSEYNKIKLQRKEKILSESQIADILILLGYRAIAKGDVKLYEIEKEAEIWRR